MYPWPYPLLCIRDKHIAEALLMLWASQLKAAFLGGGDVRRCVHSVLSRKRQCASATCMAAVPAIKSMPVQDALTCRGRSPRCGTT